MQGRFGELVSLIADAVDQNPSIPTFKAVLAMALLEAGDEHSCASSWIRRLPFILSAGDSAWFDGMINYARVVIDCSSMTTANVDRAPDTLRDQVPSTASVPNHRWP